MSRDKDYISLINSRRWMKIRKEILNKHPLCVRCEEKGYITAAHEVHHIVPVETANSYSQKENLAYNINNLMPLCHRCHVEIHREMGKCSKEENKKRQDKKIKDIIERFF